MTFSGVKTIINTKTTFCDIQRVKLDGIKQFDNNKKNHQDFKVYIRFKGIKQWV